MVCDNRVDEVLVQSISGHLAMEAVGLIRAVVTATQTVSIHCQLAVLLNMAHDLGILRNARPHWQQLTVVERTTEKERL